MLRATRATVILFLILMVPALAPAQEEIVCISCHGTLPGKLGEPVKLWKGSIHAENGIACPSCHGGDPRDMANAMKPERGFLGAPKETDIPAFCGRCHIGVEKDYLQSAHGKALGMGGPTCVTCHGNHLVVRASLDIINEKTCSQCHGFERARIIREAMAQTESHIVAIDAGINRYKGMGIDTEKLEKGLFAVRNRFHTLFHNVNVEMVKNEAVGINADLGKLDGTLAKIAEDLDRRKIIGAGAVGLALLAALILYLLKRSYDREE